MSRLTSVVISTVLLVSPQVQAAERYPVSGPGTLSCGKWMEARALKSEDIDNMLVAWLQGFLSGMNTHRLMQTKQEMSLLPDPPTLLAYVDKSCRAKPLEEVYAVSIRLYRDIQKP